MCGIFGFSRLTPYTRRMAPLLAWEMENRGRDSWGATNGIDDIKHLGPITHTWEEALADWSDWSQAIFHTRAASTGDVTLDNQHPFTIDAFDKTTQLPIRRIVGIHNGIVSNHEELNKAYSRNYACDSPHVFEAVAGNSPTTEVMGYGNLAWYEMTPSDPNPHLRLLRFNADNLYIARLKTGEVAFCSLREVLNRAARMAGTEVDTFFQTEGDQVYRIAYSEALGFDTVFNGDKMIFGLRGGYSTTSTHASRGSNFGDYDVWHAGRTHYSPSNTNNTQREGQGLGLVLTADRDANLCLKVSCQNKVQKTRDVQILCDECFADVLIRAESSPDVMETALWQ